jgi:hypothetical protein
MKPTRIIEAVSGVLITKAFEKPPLKTIPINEGRAENTPHPITATQLPSLTRKFLSPQRPVYAKNSPQTAVHRRI